MERIVGICLFSVCLVSFCSMLALHEKVGKPSSNFWDLSTPKSKYRISSAAHLVPISLSPLPNGQMWAPGWDFSSLFHAGKITVKLNGVDGTRWQPTSQNCQTWYPPVVPWLANQTSSPSYAWRFLTWSPCAALATHPRTAPTSRRSSLIRSLGRMALSLESVENADLFGVDDWNPE